ncbi:hypothetical protein L0Y65_01790 [Candidatus Micrarchaeota archaeon]|nr:hypothetical protein [Candidatus Micrarchaeota archaeon]
MEKKLVKRGNESLAIGLMRAVGSVACPCPLCMLSSAGFIANGLREELS